MKEWRPRFPASAAKVIQSRCGEQGPKPVTRRLNLTLRQGTNRPTKRANGLADRCGSRLLERGVRPHSRHDDGTMYSCRQFNFSKSILMRPKFEFESLLLQNFNMHVFLLDACISKNLFFQRYILYISFMLAILENYFMKNKKL